MDLNDYENENALKAGLYVRLVRKERVVGLFFVMI